MLFTVAVTLYEQDQVFLPRALTGLMNQQFKGFELIVVIDGEEPLLVYDPHEVCRQTIPDAIVSYRPQSAIGFREPHHGLQIAHGEYNAWLNVDNLDYPDWLQNHVTNAVAKPGAIPIVNIEYWLQNRYWGRLPQALAYGEMDLLNHALPVELSRRMDVFGPRDERIHSADWVAHVRCAREVAVEWDRDQAVCACHF